jgi:DNA-binding transcriptional ArsR family regulator
MMQREIPRVADLQRARMGGMTTEAATVLGLLSDDDRLRVVAALALGARTPAEVADRTGLDVPRAGRALARLTSGGLVDQEKDGYRLASERFRDALESLERPAPEHAPSGLGPDADKVLKAFLRKGKLTSIPAVHSKRLVILDYLARLFEPGEAYPEKVVNERLAELHPDFAALRRYMVEEEFLHRRHGYYWRAGGTFEV